MKRLINSLLAVWCLLFAANVYSQTGIYFDPDREGEGILVYTGDKRIVHYMFTYDPETCFRPPSVGPVNSVDCLNSQKWYFGTDPWAGETTSGFLFSAVGINYPKGIPAPDNPYGVIVGEPLAVGVYIIEYRDKGYRMVVVPFGEVDPDAPLYNRVFDFSDLLFAPD